MKNLRFTIALTICIVFLTACSSAPAKDSANMEVNTDQPVLELIGLEETKSLTLAELESLGFAEGWRNLRARFP